jgi:hypothetical protein
MMIMNQNNLPDMIAKLKKNILALHSYKSPEKLVAYL